MRRIALLLLAVALAVSLALSVCAATGATKVTSVAAVNADESCAVTMTVGIHLDQPVSKLTFPVPEEASAVTLNGSRVGTSVSGDARQVDLSRIAGNVAGDFTFVITYRLNDVIGRDKDGQLRLELPLLAGFGYPVESLDFTVTLPGEITAQPSFTSGYHKTNIEQALTYRVDGATVTGSSQKQLIDRETLTMLLPVTEQMYPQAVVVLQDYNLIYSLLILSAALALLYWLIFLRTAPPRPMVCAAPAEGYGAGQLGSVMRLQGADLTMMVFSWAQLGYLLIHLDKRGRVTLYKQMDMGNERSAFEQKCFRLLFGKRSQVDTSGYFYATLHQKIAKLPPNILSLVHPRSGSVLLFRSLGAILGMLGGICLGMALGADAAARGLIIFLLAVFGLLSSWHIHPWADDLFRLGKGKLLLALGLSVIWILLCAFSGQFQVVIWVWVGQLLIGLMASYGGRRTEAGRQLRSEAFGLYWYLRTLSRNEVLYICRQNPEYFHAMAPYALAMGIDKLFAKRFGSMRLPDCPYLQAGQDRELTAEQWSVLLRQTVRSMNARRLRLPLEKLLDIIQAFRK